MSAARKARVGRRDVLKGAAAAGAAIAFPTVITSSALGAGGRPPASERITMGTIGIGGRGRYDMGAFMEESEVQMVAVCDVQGGRRKGAKAIVDKKYGNADCAEYIDLRDLLARSDLDAVLIATGDNWHSMASTLAVQAGKDVYCEKPVSVTVAESRELARTVQRHDRVFQCGMQRRSIGHFQFAAHLAQSGKLGKIHTMVAEKAPAFIDVHINELPPQPEPSREEMAWDLWLGPAPWRSYNPGYYSRRFWGGHLDFAGGSITEWGSHTVDICQWANQADDTTPIAYEPAGPDGRDVTARYANGVKLEIRRGLGHGSCPVRFEGDEGWVETGDNGSVDVYPRSLRGEREFVHGYPAGNHIRNFLDCVRSHQEPVASALTAHHSITACHVANIAMRLGRAIKWDPVAEKVLDCKEGNRLLARAYREPWRL